MEHLTLENSTLREQVGELRSQIRSYEVKVKNLHLPGDVATRGSIVERQELLKKVRMRVGQAGA